MTRWFAAIGSDGTRAVVWGIGRDADQARRDAGQWLADNDPGYSPGNELDLACAEITEDQAKRVLAGEVSCATLGVRS